MDESGLLMEMLNTSDPEKWARVCYKVKRYEFINSNPTKRWEKILFWSRNLSIVAILDL